VSCYRDAAAVTGRRPRRYVTDRRPERTTSRCCSAPGGERFYGLGQHSTAGPTRAPAIERVAAQTPRSASRSWSRISGTACWEPPGRRFELRRHGHSMGVEATRHVGGGFTWITPARSRGRPPYGRRRAHAEAPRAGPRASGSAKLRYKTQAEPLGHLAVSTSGWGCHSRSSRRYLPLAAPGRLEVRPAEWPDPGAMVAETDRIRRHS